MLSQEGYTFSSNMFWKLKLAVAAKKTVRVVDDATYYYFYPEYAVDTVTICPQNAWFLHTIFTKDPWIKIVIGQFVDISMVVIYNRQETKGNL